MHNTCLALMLLLCACGAPMQERIVTRIAVHTEGGTIHSTSCPMNAFRAYEHYLLLRLVFEECDIEQFAEGTSEYMSGWNECNGQE
jgi:hypothetical protein